MPGRPRPKSECVRGRMLGPWLQQQQGPGCTRMPQQSFAPTCYDSGEKKERAQRAVLGRAFSESLPKILSPTRSGAERGKPRNFHAAPSSIEAKGASKKVSFSLSSKRKGTSQEARLLLRRCCVELSWLAPLGPNLPTLQALSRNPGLHGSPRGAERVALMLVCAPIAHMNHDALGRSIRVRGRWDTPKRLQVSVACNMHGVARGECSHFFWSFCPHIHSGFCLLSLVTFALRDEDILLCCDQRAACEPGACPLFFTLVPICSLLTCQSLEVG